MEIDPYHNPRNNEKTDYAALDSRLMRIPGIDTPTVRDLLDIGISEVVALQGRDPEVLYEEILRKKPDTPKERLYRLRLAVYFAETPDPDPKKLKPWVWAD